MAGFNIGDRVKIDERFLNLPLRKEAKEDIKRDGFTGVIERMDDGNLFVKFSNLWLIPKGYCISVGESDI